MSALSLKKGTATPNWLKNHGAHKTANNALEKIRARRHARTDAAPLGGLAAVLSVFALWGLESWHHGMAETFRIAAMGEPTETLTGGEGRRAVHACHGRAVFRQVAGGLAIGVGGMIHGETVLVGTPTFMRHQAVRLPASVSSKTVVCLAVDGELAAVFTVKYAAAEPVEYEGQALSTVATSGSIGTAHNRRNVSSSMGVSTGPQQRRTQETKKEICYDVYLFPHRGLFFPD